MKLFYILVLTVLLTNVALSQSPNAHQRASHVVILSSKLNKKRAPEDFEYSKSTSELSSLSRRSFNRFTISLVVQNNGAKAIRAIEWDNFFTDLVNP